MFSAKLFENGRSQAVRLPKECRFVGDEVLVNKIGEMVILIPKNSKWDNLKQAVNMFSDDYFKDGRQDLDNQKREKL